MEVKKIFVVGSGTMGTGIAQNAIQSGYDAILYDISAEQLEKAKASIEKQLARGVEKGRMTEEEKAACLARLEISDAIEKAAGAELVIEAASENVDIKMSIFKELTKVCGEETVFATNTSSIPITKIAGVVTNPGRFIGMHFFHPVPVMRLLEIVRGLETTDETLATAEAVGEKLGKVTIVSKDSVGFIVNRMLDPMMNEAVWLVESGVATPEDVDKGCKYGLNHPMGPFELIDMSGVDILLAVMETLYADTGDPKYRPTPLLRRMVESGRLGRKTGRGFYDYTDQK
ncbi:MAG: 3-hydroxybutyryl-CoA dehydrogenase [Clostridiales Family XIII bacterium]|jgi:3-hydroxybutyryl-CoA dehydrogenase|nr:3-hydroxybutyryl-CoA dehydrogenase [Clostridiales Family XIII bacterium]